MNVHAIEVKPKLFTKKMANSLEKINNEMGAKIRSKYGNKKGNEIIRTLAEQRDGCKYPLWGKND